MMVLPTNYRNSNGFIFMWAYYAPSMTPAGVATIFAALVTDPPRAVEPGSCVGAWTGPTYVGTFRLAGGPEVYRLAGDRGGSWTVTVEADEGEEGS